ncbi:MAG: DDE-type integrase/transposase/recombinase [Actinomycetia bacterium]|nr:DDE-type integrase/transposase/recombinase [Actinomycetes bacterium]
MNEKLRDKIALFRYGVISDLVSRVLSPGEKEHLLTQITSQEWEIPATTRHTVGRSTARDWVAQYQALGFDGLKPAMRSDSGRSRALPEAVQELLLKLQRERPEAPVSSLIRAARLSGLVDLEQRMASSTVHRLLAPHRQRSAQEGTEPDAVAFTHPHTGDLWMSDLMHGPRLQVPGRRKGAKCYLYAFLDDATRMVPYAGFYNVENAACFQEAFKQALLRRGIPRRLYCDNGATFRTHHLRVICATLNIALIHSRPYRPRGRGKVERFFRRVRKAFLSLLDAGMLDSLSSLNRVFWAWLEAEYHQTSHRALEGQTPLERFLDDQALVRPAPENLEALMRMKAIRKVGRDRIVHLHSRLYEAPDGYAAEKVEVLFDPYDRNRPVHFRRPGESQELPLRPVDLHTNATLKRPQRQSEAQDDDAPQSGISYLELLAKTFYQEDS